MHGEADESGNEALDHEVGPVDSPKGAVMLALAVMATILSAIAVVGIAGALSPNDECPAYGYGGYNCVDYDDATLVVTPATDVVDYQYVTVNGFDFDPPWAPFAASQCAAADIAINGQDGCDSDTTFISNVNGAGRITFSMRVKRIIETNALGDVDCAVEGACVIGAATVEGTPTDFVVIEGTSAPISFDPDVPPVDFDDAQIFVDPATDLVDRQTVTVSGIDLDPHFNTFGAAQCDAALVMQFQADACDLSTSVLGTVDGNGDVEVEMQVRRIITTAAGGEIDCAVPDACDIGGGTIEGFATPIEGARVPISFDPTVPPVPPLEIEIAVTDASADSVSGTVTCNREATFEINVDLVQERAGHYANAYGYFYDGSSCDVDPTDFTLQMQSGNRRLVGGPADLFVWAYANDGFEFTFVEHTEVVGLQGGAPISTPAVDMRGEFTTVHIVGTEGSGEDAAILLDVVCSRWGEFVSLQVSVQQWAGRERVSGSGFTQLEDCDGTHRVAVPFTTYDGILAGGPARVDAWATLHDHTPGDSYHDSASATDDVRLSGRVKPTLFTPEPDPGSRITIDEVTRSSVSGTVECDEAVSVDLYASGVQLKGRRLNQADGYDFFECDGTTPFSIDISMYGDRLGGGKAAIFVSGYAYRLIDQGEYPYYEYVWDDQQQATVKVSGAG